MKKTIMALVLVLVSMVCVHAYETIRVGETYITGDYAKKPVSEFRDMLEELSLKRPKMLVQQKMSWKEANELFPGLKEMFYENSWNTMLYENRKKNIAFFIAYDKKNDCVYLLGYENEKTSED